MLLSNDRR